MNARLLILAILAAVILALFMTVSAPSAEPGVEIRMTLGGDCSADRATGDLYHPLDPYCLVAQGPAIPVTGSMAPNGPGAGLAAEDDHEVSAPPADEQRKERKDDTTNTEVDAPIPPQGGDGPDIQPAPPVVEDNGGPGPHVDEPTAAPPTSGPQDPPDEQDKDRPGDQGKEKGPKDKQCKQDGRDNVNAQGNHDCSADNPDGHSGQERTSEHGNQADQGNEHNRDKEKKDK